MSKRAKTRIAGAVAVVLLATGLGLAATGQGAQAEAAGQANQLAGLWIVEVTPEPGTGIPPFQNIATVTKDGAIVNTSPDGSAAVGQSERLRGHTYAVTFMGFADETQRVVVRSTIELSGDSFSGPFRTEIQDLDGNVVFALEGTVSATRQQVEPFPG